MNTILLLILPIFPIFSGLLFHVQQSPINDASTEFINKNDLFDHDEVLEITLSGSLREVLNDRFDEPSDFAVTLSYVSSQGENIAQPVMLSTRGHFRRMKSNCIYPPLLIKFDERKQAAKSIFSEQKKLKLVMPCRGDEFVVREWLVYRAYQLLTPYSFKARLVKVSLADDRNKKTPVPFFGILLEEEGQMAQRNGMISAEIKLHPLQTEILHFLKVAVFEYMIGNTDWSVQFLQNIKLLTKDSTSVPIVVPYDFDHSGLVDAPYARPTPELNMSSIRQRRYRGYCENNIKLFEPIIDSFKNIKIQLYALYEDNQYISEKYKTATLKYLDQFYKTLDNPSDWKKEFLYPCDKDGTGNIVIKGLK